MTSAAFRRFGVICASHSWQVIFSTLGAVFFGVTTVSLYAPMPEGFFCKGPFLGGDEPGVSPASLDHKIEVIFMYLTSCAATVYLFYQFQSLRKMGPRYVMGLIAFFIFLAVLAFFVATTSFLGLSFGTLGNFLPFFLLLVDLHKASLVAIKATSSETREELVHNIGQAMEQVGPCVLLDTTVEILVFSAASLSSYGLSSVKSISCFGTVSAIANFVVFVGIFPPLLSVMTEVSIKETDKENSKAVQTPAESRSMRKSSLAYRLSRLSFSSTYQITDDDLQSKANPVLLGIKIVMGLSLAVIHVYSHILGGPDSALPISPRAPIQRPGPSPPVFWSLLADLSDRVHLSPEQVVSIVVGLLLAIRFHFDDTEAESAATAAALEKPPSSSSSSSIDPSTKSSSLVSTQSSARGERESTEAAMPTFFIGEFEGCVSDASTQTDNIESVIDSGLTGSLPESAFTAVDSISNSPRGDVPSTSSPFTSPITAPFSPRSEAECFEILGDGDRGPSHLSDEEIVMMVDRRKILSYNLEKVLGDPVRGVKIRRLLLARKMAKTPVETTRASLTPDSTTTRNAAATSLTSEARLSALPYEHLDYSLINGVCCENVVGYVTIPVGIVGPLKINGLSFEVPLSTLEGALVASTNRGCKALTTSGGVTARVLDQGMTRGPLVAFENVREAKEASDWLKLPETLEEMRSSFSSTTRFGRLESVTPKIVGRLAFIRFKARTGDAMGMNMISKGVEKCLETLRKRFPAARVLSVSGNYCVDKKANALNWIEGRGWSVTAEAVISAKVVRDLLKTSATAMVELNVGKNLVGSAIAGSVGGFNAHAANIVTALFLATGQDAAQAGTSASCLTFMELTGENREDLYVSVTMPSIECGVVGGGTGLPPQQSCLQLLGIGREGEGLEEPGKKAERLAVIVASTVMAGELSLMAALAAGQLVNSHLRLNRSSGNLIKDAQRLEEEKKPKDERR